MRNFAVTLVASLLAFGTVSAVAQERLSAEFRVGASIPTEDLDTIDLDTGFGFEGTVTYLFAPTFGAYGGWGWRNFGSNDLDVEQTGYTIGLQFSPELPNTSLSLRLRAGVTYEHIELENDNGDIVDDSKHGVGFEIGAAVPFALNDQWSITPGIRYRSLNRDIEVAGIESDVDLNYFALDVGISRKF